MKHTATGYAPVDKKGFLYIHVCHDDKYDLFKIYRTKETAEENCIVGDVVKKVTITVED